MAGLVRYNCVLHLLFWLFSLELVHLDLPRQDSRDYCTTAFRRFSRLFPGLSDLVWVWLQVGTKIENGWTCWIIQSSSWTNCKTFLLEIITTKKAFWCWYPNCLDPLCSASGCFVFVWESPLSIIIDHKIVYN